MLEMLVAYGCPVIVGGDLNVHVEDPADATTLLDLLTTHVIRPTHRQGGTLDLVITYTDCTVLDVQVDPANIISDPVISVVIVTFTYHAATHVLLFSL